MTSKQYPSRSASKIEVKKGFFRKRNPNTNAKKNSPQKNIIPKQGFGKIICISGGYFNPKKGEDTRLPFYGEEIQLLKAFGTLTLVNEHFNKLQHLFCAHNGKEFDFPSITRRMLIKGIPIPGRLHMYGKKPWEIPYLDTLELWKFGNYKHLLLCIYFPTVLPQKTILTEVRYTKFTTKRRS